MEGRHEVPVTLTPEPITHTWDATGRTKEDETREYFSRIISEINRTPISIMPDVEEIFQQEIRDAVEDFMRDIQVNLASTCSVSENYTMVVARAWEALVTARLCQRDKTIATDLDGGNELPRGNQMTIER